MDRYIFSGNLGMDCTTNQSQTGRVAIGFSVAVNRRLANGENQTKWVRCTLWRDADKTKIAEYLTKGKKVLIEGSPQASAWTDKQGQVQSSLEVTVYNIELLGGEQPAQPAQQAAQPQQQQHYPTQNPVQPAPAPQPMDTGDDDLPF